MEFEKLCRNYGIDHLTEGTKHCTGGWINIRCPFCEGSDGYHMGFNEDRGNFHCWRCGSHKTIEVICKLLRVSGSEAYQTILKYKGRRKSPVKGSVFKRRQKVSLPIGTRSLSQRGHKYLVDRGYDSKELERVWGLHETGPTGPYKFRVIAPIYQDRILISYQGRDFTGKQDPPYKACYQEEEAKDHKHCLYGEDLIEGNSILVVEGVTDVWRLGPGSVATFGTAFTIPQVSRLKKYKKVFILYDSESQAQKQAEKLASLLSAFCVVEIWTLGSGDPGELKQKDADEIMEIVK